MDQPKRIVHPEQRFGLSQEKVASRQQIRNKILHDTAPGGQVEVDQHIAAEDDVEPTGTQRNTGKITESLPVMTRSTSQVSF